MKKIIPATLLVLALAAAGGTVYLAQKPKLDARAASAASGYLPAQTLVLLSLPDPGQTAEDWKTTDLYKIWTEPQVQAFLAKPLSKVPADKDADDTWAQIQRLDPKNLFVAVTALDEKNNQPHFVGGFQFEGKPEDVNKLLASPKEAVRKKYPAGKADLQQYQGHPVETFDNGNGVTVASVFAGQWYLIGNDLPLLKSTLDHLEGRAPANAATLEKEADFQAVSAKLPKGHATLLFARPKTFLDKLYAFTAATGQNVDPAQRAEADKIKAVGATTTIEKGKLRDTFYMLAPGYRRPEAPVALSALPLTSMDTLLYVASALNIPEDYHLPTAPAGSPGASVYAGLNQFAKSLEVNGVTLATFRTSFGRELTIQLDWPANGAQPSLLASLDVRDRVAAGKFVDGLTSVLGGIGDFQEQKQAGLTLHVLASENLKFISPAYGLTDKHFLLGLSAAGLSAAAEHAKTGGPNFTGTQAYKDSMATVPKGTTSVGYVDMRGIFERTYNALKPLAAFSTMMAPQVGEYVEIGKLPDTDTIAKHLSPIVYSQSGDDQGALIESVGPITFLQAQIGTAGLIGASAIPILQKQFGLFGPKTGQEEAPEVDTDASTDDAPQSTPAGTP